MESIGLFLDGTDHVVEPLRHAVGNSVLEEFLDTTPSPPNRLEDLEQLGNTTLADLGLPYPESLTAIAEVRRREHVSKGFLEDVALREVRVRVEELLEGDLLPTAQVLAGVQQHVALALDDTSPGGW